jgi:hypothetical protein
VDRRSTSRRRSRPRPGPARRPRRPRGRRSGTRDRRRGRRGLVGGHRQRVAPDATRSIERAVRDRSAREHGGQPGAAAPPLDEGPVRVVRGALPAGRSGRQDPRRVGSRPPPVRPAGHGAARGRPPRGDHLLPPIGEDPGPDALHAPAVQHLDRADLRPEPGGRARLRPRDRGERLPAGGADDRRGLGGGLRSVGLPPGPLPGPEGDDGRAPRHGLQGHALGLPLHPARWEGLHRALPRREPDRVAPQREGTPPAGHPALVGRLQRRRRPHQPPRPRLAPRAAAPPRRDVRSRRLRRC